MNIYEDFGARLEVDMHVIHGNFNRLQNAVLAAAGLSFEALADDGLVIGGQPVKYLSEFGYAGKVYPVNPKRDTIRGLTCYPSVSALPEANFRLGLSSKV